MFTNIFKRFRFMQKADSQSIHNNARQMMPASRLQCREIFEKIFHFVIESEWVSAEWAGNHMLKRSRSNKANNKSKEKRKQKGDYFSTMIHKMIVDRSEIPFTSIKSNETFEFFDEEVLCRARKDNQSRRTKYRSLPCCLFPYQFTQLYSCNI